MKYDSLKMEGRMKFKPLIMLSSVVLIGCESPEELRLREEQNRLREEQNRIEHDLKLTQICESYGFKINTIQFANCKMKVDYAIQQNKLIQQERASKALGSWGDSIMCQSSGGYYNSLTGHCQLPKMNSMTCTQNGIFTNCNW